MASVSISIDNDTILSRFDSALVEASSVACDMIQVKTKIECGSTLKVIRTECASALAVFRALNAGGSIHD